MRRFLFLGMIISTWQTSGKNLMKDLKDAKWMWVKAVLLLLIGLTAAVLIMVENATLRTGLLLVLTIWSFCRAYYFAFYVIEHYIDPSYRFSGLMDFVGWVTRRKQQA